MRSSRSRLPRAWAVATVVATAWSSPAEAQKQAQGFDVERLYTSAPGGGWVVMDTLDIHGGLGGAVSAVTSYAHDPVVIRSGSQRLAVVSDQAFLQLGFALTYHRFRLYGSFDSPLLVEGSGGTIGGYTFAAPGVSQSPGSSGVDPGSAPDVVTHGRAGFDIRALGAPGDPFRIGIGVQLWMPGGQPGASQSNYLSDGPPSNSLGAYWEMVRVLFAGDVGKLTYAGHVGVNFRPLDESPQPESPRGSEALFGLAGGAKLAICGACNKALVVGPEIYGVTAIRSMFGTDTTALEAMMTGRVEGTGEVGPQLRFKLGAGAGLDPHFGAPTWRVVLGVELFARSGSAR
jgi:hypothetical protein